MERGMDAWREWLINSVRDAFIPIILSTGISLLANKTFIQRSQEIRLHSQTINDESFKKWFYEINNMCPIDIEDNLPTYSHEKNRIVPNKLKKLELIPHQKYLESHMKNGYPEEWGAWVELRESIKNFNEQIADTLQYIQDKFCDESFNVLVIPHYFRIGHERPLEYINTVALTEKIYKEILHRLSGYADWMYGDVVKSSVMRGEARFFQLAIGSSGPLIMEVKNERSVDAVIDFIPKHLVDQQYTVKINDIKEKAEGLENQRNEFKHKLEDIISNIELGKSVKGNCINCSRLYQLRTRFWEWYLDF